MKKTENISSIKHYHKNPRTLSDKQRELLNRDLQELGDLSGIVHDINSNEIIGGNQRSEIFGEAKIIITETFNKPTKQGTIALGYVIWKGEKFSYRQVKWTSKQCEKANIVSNKAGGDWNFDSLTENFQLPDLMDWGFDIGELDTTVSKLEEHKENLSPYTKHHILISFNPNCYIEISDLFEKIKSLEGVEIEQSAN